MAAVKQDDGTKAPREAKKLKGATERSKRYTKDGKVRPEFNLPKPKLGSHPDVAPEAAGGNGNGVNNLDFSNFWSGDIVVGLGTPTGHAGLYDEWYDTGSIYDKKIWSANTQPVNGVQRETPDKYRHYDYAYGTWVPSASYDQACLAADFCYYQNGKPYNISSSKSNVNEWYCSKLPWAAYYYTWPSKDLDADGGFWVWPADLIKDNDTAEFAYSD